MKKHFLILILITAMTVSKAQIQGRYAIQNVHTGKNIRPFEAGKQDGNQIILYNHHAWKCMTWEFSQVNGDIYHLSNRYTEKTFQPKTAAISGVPLVQKSIEAGSNTEWEFLLQDDKTYLIRLRDTELYLTISSEKVNSDIILAFKSNLDNQRWRLVQQDPWF